MNVISYEVFKALKKGFCKSSTILTSFSNSSTKVMGKTSLTLCHEGFKDESIFYIAEPGKATQTAILGRTWGCVKTNAQLIGKPMKYTWDLRILK